MQISHKKFNEAVAKMLVPIDETDIFYEKNGKLYVGEALLPNEDVNTLAQEARTIRDMFLFRLFLRNIRFSAYQRAMEFSDDYEAVLFGKALVYELKVLEQMVKDLAKMDLPKVEAKLKDTGVKVPA